MPIDPADLATHPREDMINFHFPYNDADAERRFRAWLLSDDNLYFNGWDLVMDDCDAGHAERDAREQWEYEQLP